MRLAFSIIFLFIVLTIILLAITYGETIFLKQIYIAQPVLNSGLSNPEWVDEFQTYAYYGAGFAGLITLIWLVAGATKYQVEDFSNAGGRWFWIALLTILILVTLIAGILIPTGTQNLGSLFAITFYLINALVIYWFSSAVFSPPNIKYAPLGSYNLATIANKIMKPLQGVNR